MWLGRFLIVAIMAGAACSADRVGGFPPLLPRYSAQLKPDTATILVGSTLSMQLTLDYYRDGVRRDLPAGTRVEWSSSNSAIVSVDSTGVARAISVGDALIFAGVEEANDVSTIRVRASN